MLEPDVKICHQKNLRFHPVQSQMSNFGLQSDNGISISKLLQDCCPCLIVCLPIVWKVRHNLVNTIVSRQLMMVEALSWSVPPSMELEKSLRKEWTLPL